STHLCYYQSPLHYSLFFLTATAPTAIYTLSLHDALPICSHLSRWANRVVSRLRTSRLSRRAMSARNSLKCSTSKSWKRRYATRRDRKSTRLNSSHDQISYAVFCLKKKKKKKIKPI